MEPFNFHSSLGWQIFISVRSNKSFEVKSLQKTNDLQSIIYIENIGYSVNNTRLELYLNGYEEENFERLTLFIQRIIDTLTHTPFGNFGVNFHFVESEPDDAIYDLLKSADSIDIHYKVEVQEFKASVRIEDNLKLNLLRIPLEDKVVFDFNYERTYTGLNSFSWLTKEKFVELLDDSIVALGKLYGLSEYKQVVHPFDSATTTEGGRHGEDQN